MRVRYQDGITSTEYTADLEVSSLGIRIHYVDGTGQLQEVFWAADTLDPVRIEKERPIYLRRKGYIGPYIRFATEADFAPIPAAFPHVPIVVGASPVTQFTNSMQTSRLMAVLVIAFLVFGLLVYAFIDSFGRVVSAITPTAWDVAAGKEIYKQRAKESINEDKKASVKAQAFFKATGFTSRFPIEVHVDRTNVVNAFALPGGQIILNKGLIARTQKPEELAGVLAHELGHVDRRHTFQHLARMGVVYLVVSALVGDVTGIVAVLVENGQAIFGLTYNRRMEDEADTFALEQMLEEKIDPNGLISFFSILEDQEEERDMKLPDILSTHPATPARIAKIKASLPKQYRIDQGRKEQLKEAFKALKAEIEN